MIPKEAERKEGKPQNFTMVYNGQHAQFRNEEFDVTVFGGLEQTALLLAPKPRSKLNGIVPDEIKPEIEADLRRRGYTKKPIYPTPPN